MYTLEFITGSRAGQHLTVAREKFVIGNHPEADLLLGEVPDGTAVRLSAGREGVRAELLGQARVEDREASPHLPLRYGDRIALGPVRIQYVPTGVQWAGSEEDRRINHIQGITFGLVVLVILLEVSLVGLLAVLRVDSGLPAQPLPAGKTETQAAESAEASSPSPSPPPSPAEESAVPAAAAGETAATAATSEPATAAPPAPATAAPPVAPAARTPSPTRQEVTEAAPPRTASPQPQPTSAAPTTATTATAAAGPEAVWPPVEEPDDPLHRIAAQMVATALVEVLRHNYVEAHREFERARILSPDFYPAYAEEAQLYEKQGQLEEAGKLWEEVLKRCPTGPWFDLASRERHRLTREAARRTTPLPRSRKPAQPPPPELPRQIRILGVQLQEAGAVGDFRDVRLLNIQLKSRLGHPLRDASAVTVKVRFYDRDPASGSIVPSRALVPQKEIPLHGVWKVGEIRSISAAYLAPAAEKDGTAPLEFYGYLVQVYYQQELQDQRAEPESLLQREGVHREP